MSPLMRGRGLKHQKHGTERPCNSVAPHAGAWIETALPSLVGQVVSCRPSCGGVD